MSGTSDSRTSARAIYSLVEVIFPDDCQGNSNYVAAFSSTVLGGRPGSIGGRQTCRARKVKAMVALQSF
jgi:hypothetical protein